MILQPATLCGEFASRMTFLSLAPIPFTGRIAKSRGSQAEAQRFAVADSPRRGETAGPLVSSTPRLPRHDQPLECRCRACAEELAAVCEPSFWFFLESGGYEIQDCSTTKRSAPHESRRFRNPRRQMLRRNSMYHSSPNLPETGSYPSSETSDARPETL